MGETCCDICGAALTFDSCWDCAGAGGWHDCGEDTCCCLDPDEITEVCEACEGDGELLACPDADDHTPEQIDAWKARHA